MRRVILFILLVAACSVPVSAQISVDAISGCLRGATGCYQSVPITTVANLASFAITGRLVAVTDSTSATTCTAGGSAVALCQYTGTGWVAVPQAGVSGVSAFNGRSGAVSPASGDYAFSDLSGLASDTQIPKDVPTSLYNTASYGAAGDVQHVSNCSASSGSGVYTCTSAGFSSGDVGKVAIVSYQQNPPLNLPSLSQTAGGSIGATTYYVITACNQGTGESTGSVEANLAVSANNVLNVAGLTASTDCLSTSDGWNVFVSTSTGTETKQNSAPIAFGTAWVEPTSGLVSGAALPATNTTNYYVQTTISAYTSSSQVTLTAAPTKSLTSALLVWGTDQATAFGSAQSAAAGVLGTVYVPDGNYLVSAISCTSNMRWLLSSGANVYTYNPLNCDSSVNVRFKGPNVAASAASSIPGGGNIWFVGSPSSASIMSLRSSLNFVMDGVDLISMTKGYTGYAFDFGHVTVGAADASNFFVQNGLVEGWDADSVAGNTDQMSVLFNLADAIFGNINHLHMRWAQVGVDGCTASVCSYSNGMHFDTDYFDNFRVTALADALSDWTVIDPFVEGTDGTSKHPYHGMPYFYKQVNSAGSNDLVVVGGWMGDYVNGSAWIDYRGPAHGAVVGTSFSNPFGVAVKFESTSTQYGWSFIGNSIGGLNGIDFTTSVAGQGTITGNDFNTGGAAAFLGFTCPSTVPDGYGSLFVAGNRGYALNVVQDCVRSNGNLVGKNIYGVLQGVTVTSGSGGKSGACPTMPAVYFDTGTGKQYNCESGAWVAK